MRRRYYLQRVPLSEPDAPQVTERVRAMRQLLDDNPKDEELWLQYIEFQVGAPLPSVRRVASSLQGATDVYNVAVVRRRRRGRAARRGARRASRRARGEWGARACARRCCARDAPR